jgi:hypothetical protein
LPNLNKSISTNGLRFINKIPNSNGYYTKQTEISKYIFPFGETAGDDPNVGVYFIEENNDRIKVDTEDVVINNSSQAVFLIPSDLPSDTYILELRMLRSGNKHIQKGQLPDKLNV